MEKTAIVILGAPNDETGELSSIAKERCHQAISEFRANAGASIIATGGWGEHFNTASQPHGHYSREYVVAHGVPKEAFVECVESSNTVEDARLCRSLVERYGFRRLVVVTSDFHVARAQFLFAREFPDIALTFSGSMTHLPEEELQKKILHEKNALARLRGDV